MMLPDVVVGLILVLFGRKLYWLFVAAAGFVVGMSLSKQWLAGTDDFTASMIGLGVGLACAVLAIFLRRLAIGIAGFFAGGHIAFQLAAGLGYESSAWIVFLLGGIIGAILILVVFDWAL